ncbi:BZ3500_MvSof-1268-A1-R1_Chr5-1g07651 [Microbotryum saponariae]|uniref:BZ3500_MvSof-1268-A1-R1_Chr5-1g07651 protein n=1 Tax=Microbotryum saponariae TaxID=289078 RepID=A0A2X0ND52_9BASI|nr:BZ3500_MvSof-1268-A1-R1_Chr5-1g07651 [Microbotryum saponariae]SDA05522.1 BZ3501_MvSof-1269-A2-R1_Chr5-2g07475 [Microbotryum saponariae]
MCTVSQPVHILPLPLFAASAPACSTHARAPPPHTPEICQSTSPVLTDPLPPPRHRQLAITALIFHRPSRASPMHDARRSQPALVATDSLAHQHSTMVDKFPLVSAVQHSPSQSLDGPLGVRSCFAMRPSSLT